MTIRYSKPVATQFLYRTYTQTTTWSFTIYPGTQPSADNFTANWATQSYKDTFLVHWQGTGTTWQQSYATVYGSGNFIELYTFPAAVTSYTSTTQTATWGIMWAASITQATLLAATSAPPSLNYIVVPVTDLGGNGCIRLVSTTIAPATTYALNDASLTIDVNNALFF